MIEQDKPVRSGDLCQLLSQFLKILSVLLSEPVTPWSSEVGLATLRAVSQLGLTD